MSWTEPSRAVPHTMPVDDLIMHIPQEDCVCVPSPRPITENIYIQDQDAPIGQTLLGTIWIHHSLDGRESNE